MFRWFAICFLFLIQFFIFVELIMDSFIIVSTCRFHELSLPDLDHIVEENLFGESFALLLSFGLYALISYIHIQTRAYLFKTFPTAPVILIETLTIAVTSICLYFSLECIHFLWTTLFVVPDIGLSALDLIEKNQWFVGATQRYIYDNFSIFRGDLHTQVEFLKNLW